MKGRDESKRAELSEEQLIESKAEEREEKSGGANAQSRDEAQRRTAAEVQRLKPGRVACER